MKSNQLFKSNSKTNIEQKYVHGGLVQIENECFYKIENNDAMRPFFMSIVSDSNHWMFISSNGGLSAGRKNSDNALFPYYTDDKITESNEITGSKSIFLVRTESGIKIWEPFSERFNGYYNVSNNLYKNTHGNKVIFEEINHDLGLTFRYQWNSSNIYGFVKKSTLINTTKSSIEISLLDGLQNIMPYGVSSDFQNSSSNLIDAYKRSELEKQTGLGIFALSAIIVDKPEPSEALKANIVWSIGLDNPKYLLSSLQLKNFRKHHTIQEELDVKAEKGAYFVHANLILEAETQKEWMLIANVNQDQSAIVNICDVIKTQNSIKSLIEQDIARGTKKLIDLAASSDGLQTTADSLKDTRHFANTLFNIMRGGVFHHNYQIPKKDFTNYLSKANKEVFENSKQFLKELKDEFSLLELKTLSDKSENVHFKRLCLEYLPLKFSRRHGDPSRPWNKFSINTLSEIDGSEILDYQGNWRDIFQNWEALSYAYPYFIESIIHKFLNASTFDGYNPYRVTKDGFDWEIIEEHDPWSYIGYWGDHQIIYLLKFLEFIENHNPGKLNSYFDQDVFVYANVPYKIKCYEAILKNPKDTIDFDYKLNEMITKKRLKLGADGALLTDQSATIYSVNFIEKILATLLAKISNFIPEAGIWLNTQRPEWNDANNALVGNGVSMVTLYYLKRFLNFFNSIIENSKLSETLISEELLHFFNTIFKVLYKNKELLSDPISNLDKKTILDALGSAGSLYRTTIYTQSFSGNKKPIALKRIRQFVSLTSAYFEHTIRANKREDNLYHAYNLMTVIKKNEVTISYLDEMLEGQVAVLSSGYISSAESLELLDALKASKLFRDDQYSYLLYPNKELPQFLAKNVIPVEDIMKSQLLQKLMVDGNTQIVKKDSRGDHHFNGNFNNVNYLETELIKLEDSAYSDLVKKDKRLLLETFEKVFNHKAFTGRSGTFFGYEGLGSIYWHMVSKLQLAVQETCLKAIGEDESTEVIGRLLEHYYEINEGIGVHKSPSLYGAFPTDPYSHTPLGKGAQQPGMTGQVKEDILSRIWELGVFVANGRIVYNPCLLRKVEFLNLEKIFNYIDVDGNEKQISLAKNTLAFTYCKVPIIYNLFDKNGILVTYKNKKTKSFDSLVLDQETSSEIFSRSGKVKQIAVFLTKNIFN